MTTKIGINGFGRIGRQVLKAMMERFPNELEVVAINDLFDSKTNAHLFKYDSNYGIFPGTVEVSGNNDIVVNGHTVKVLAEKDPARLPWKDLGVDIVIESTGIFTDAKGQPEKGKAGANAHIDAGAKKVIISAPAKNEDLTVVLGVNADKYDPAKHHIISNASCTTNCLAPAAKVVHDRFKIVNAVMTTIHSYTNDQVILDQGHKKEMRRSRAAGLNIIPTTTGAAKALKEVLPAMAGKLDGMAIRVPTPNVSLVDLTARLEKKASAKEVNDAFRAAAAGPLKGILAVSDEPLVSCDFNGDRHSSTVDAALTTVAGDQVKVMAWYDNEMGYSQRLFDLAKFVAERL